MTYRILRGDVLSFARHYRGPLFHALLCDAPYNLESISKRFSKPSQKDYEVARSNPHRRTSGGFMNSHWDTDIAFHKETWGAFWELLYPGAFIMVFGGSRTSHRLACAIEDAGFILHPTVYLWAFGSGFPKATNISKQIDNMMGVERRIVGHSKNGSGPNRIKIDNHKHGDTGIGNWDGEHREFDITESQSEIGLAWEGHRYGLQALKPAVEPIIVAQKPYEERPVDNITMTGAGALNIDAGRIGIVKNVPASKSKIKTGTIYGKFAEGGIEDGDGFNPNVGRWPANFILQHSPQCKRIGEKQIDGYAINRFTDGAKPFGGGAGHEYTTEQMPAETIAEWECVPECPVKGLGEQSGKINGKRSMRGVGYTESPVYGEGNPEFDTERGYDDSGNASRFFYNSSWEYEQQEPDWNIEVDERLLEADPVRYEAKASTAERNAGLNSRCGHPTVKPISLTRHLASLLLPPDRYSPRRLFVPFSGVSSEMIGALLAGWDEIVGVEGEADYAKIGRTRLAWWEQRMKETGLTEPKAILKANGKSTTRKNGKKKDKEQTLF